ncbi:MAG TPA: hypothetical protein VKA84_19815 [Gemmatimonadaceae bacterium]|nr:hypothetical protein [Gemmatimonadaceae bacterium]
MATSRPVSAALAAASLLCATAPRALTGQPPRHPPAREVEVGTNAQHTSLAATLLPLGLGLGVLQGSGGAGGAGGAIALGGLVLGPSAGYFQAGLPRRAALGLSLRAAGTALVASSVASASFCERDCPPPLLTWLSVLGGTGLVVGSAATDLGRVRYDARDAASGRREASPRVDPKSPDARGASAQATSVAATLVPVAVGVGLMSSRGNSSPGPPFIALGLVAGPAMGYFEGGLPARAGAGMALRTLGTYLIVGGVLGPALCEGPSCNPGAARSLLVAGSALTLGSAAWDLLRVRGDVARAERRRASRPRR